LSEIISLEQRAREIVGLRFFNQINAPERITKFEVRVPRYDIYVLRMLISSQKTGLQLPGNLFWLRPFVHMCMEEQRELGIEHPYIYLTVRNGNRIFETVDEWHVDGFAVRYTHLPEQNYIWSNNTPTQFLLKPHNFPGDFNPMRHNVHSFIQEEHNVEEDDVMTGKRDTVYRIDPYVIHRAQASSVGATRCFVRVSFVPIEIQDCNNTPNPALPTIAWSADGVNDFRNQLENYHNATGEL